MDTRYKFVCVMLCAILHRVLQSQASIPVTYYKFHGFFFVCAALSVHAENVAGSKIGFFNPASPCNPTLVRILFESAPESIRARESWSLKEERQFEVTFILLKM